jgi:hypothetical protein
MNFWSVVLSCPEHVTDTLKKETISSITSQSVIQRPMKLSLRATNDWSKVKPVFKLLPRCLWENIMVTFRRGLWDLRVKSCEYLG